MTREYIYTNNLKAKKLKKKIDLINKEKKRFNIKVNGRNHTVLLTPYQIIENTKIARAKKMTLEDYLKHKYDLKNLRNREKTTSKFSEFEREFKKYVKDNEIDLSILKYLHTKGNDTMELEKRNNLTKLLVREFKNITFLEKATGVSYNKLYKYNHSKSRLKPQTY